MPKRFNRMLEIRQLTGMSQEEPATMLNTSRSSVAMHETTGRGLPDNASLYLGFILVEIYKPEHQASIPTPTLSAASAEQWKKELQWLAGKKRFEAEKLKRRMDAHNQKETQRRNRLLLPLCVEKAQTTLLAQSSGTPWQPITERHVKWLEMIKTFASYNGFEESVHLQQLKNQLRYNLLIKEAEEAERMAADLSMSDV